MLGRKPWVRWPPASSDMPSRRWLPNSCRSVSQSASLELVDVLGAEPLERRRLDVVGQDRPEGDQVGVDAGVRLHIGVRRAEQLAGVLGRDASRRCRRSGSRRRSGGRRCPRRTCRRTRCPSSAARPARRSSRWRSASASPAGRRAPGGSPRRSGARRWRSPPGPRRTRSRRSWPGSRRSALSVRTAASGVPAEHRDAVDASRSASHIVDTRLTSMGFRFVKGGSTP